MGKFAFVEFVPSFCGHILLERAAALESRLQQAFLTTAVARPIASIITGLLALHFTIATYASLCIAWCGIYDWRAGVA
jgi:hypothetical protein